MRLRTTALIGGALLAASSHSVGQAAKKMDKPMAAKPAASAEMMKPAPEMSKVSGLNGNWQCMGKVFASSMGPEHPTEATVSVHTELGGRWQVSHYKEKKTAQNQTPMEGDEYWGYDPAEKRWDRIAIDSWGGWSTGDAKDWEGNSITWMSEGMMMGSKAKYRDTFTKTSDTEIVYKGQAQASDGKWVDLWETTCKKK
jgi:hypothetical protein